MQAIAQNDLYPSRVADKPELLPRRDPVVAGSGKPKSPLTPELVKQFENDGFISIQNVFTNKEVNCILNIVRAMGRNANLADREEMVFEPESEELRSIFAPHELSPIIGQLAADTRLLNVVEYLLGEKTYVHQSRINLKPPFQGKEFYWHSDFETWHVEDGMPRMRAISASIALTPNTSFNGPLMLIPGSHRHFIACTGRTPQNHYKRSLKRQEYGVPDKETLAKMAAIGGIKAPIGEAGSVTFFDCNILHGSNSNISPLPRSNAFFVYNAVSNRLVEPYSGQPPRPEFIAARGEPKPLAPAMFTGE